MKKKLLAHIHGIKKKSKSAFYVTGISTLAIVAIIFVSTRFSTPHTSELNFKEYSSIGRQAGSVVPASCVSGVHYTHPNDINVDNTVDSGCLPICSAGQSVNTTNQYRCYYTGPGFSYDANLGYMVPVTIYSFSAWQNTTPSCPAGNYLTTLGDTQAFPSGTVQQKDVYSCAVNVAAPTLSSTCHYNGANTSVTVSWPAVPNATGYDYLRIADLTSPEICYGFNFFGWCTGFMGPQTYTPTINPDGLSFDYPITSGYNYRASVSSVPGLTSGAVDFSCSQPPSVNLYFTP